MGIVHSYQIVLTPTVPWTDTHESERDTLAYQFPTSSKFSESIFYHNGIAYFRDLLAKFWRTEGILSLSWIDKLFLEQNK